MKKIAFLLFAAMGMMTTAHAQYHIKGKMDGFDVKRMYLHIHGEVADSADVAADGTYEMRGKEPMKGADYVQLGNFQQGVGIALWLMNDTVEVTMHSTGAFEVSGAKVEDEYQSYRKHMASIWNQEQAMLDQANDDLNRAGEFSKRVDLELRPKEDSIFMEWAKQHPRSYVALNHVYNMRNMNKYDFDRYMNMISVMDTTAFGGSQWETMQKFIIQDRALEPGHPFPTDIRMADALGDTLTLSGMRGKVVLLTLCYPTQDEYTTTLDLRKSLYAKYRNQGLEILDVYWSDVLSDLVKSVANHRITWNVVSDFKSWGSPMANILHIDRVPHLFIIDRQGNIISHNTDPEDVESMIRKAL